MNRRLFLVVLAPVVSLAALAACSDDDPATTPAPDGGGGQETGTTDSPSTSDSPSGETSTDAGQDVQVTVTQLAKFNATFGELAEGVAVIPSDAGAGFPVVGFAPQGRVVQVLADGGYSEYAAFAGATGSFTLGMAVDVDRSLLVAVADTSGGAGVPPAGVYRIPFGGGTPVLFAATAGMSFVNGLALKGTDLYITDSTGTIFKANAVGVTTGWLTDGQLAGDENDCKLGNGFPIGANGVAYDAANLYVANTDKGAIYKIAINGDGSAGAISLVKKDPSLCGADGLVIDKDGSFLVAVNAKNAIMRVTAAGVVSTVKQGDPLDSPASLWIDTNAGARRLLITNAAFTSSAADGGKPNPGLLSIPLAP